MLGASPCRGYDCSTMRTSELRRIRFMFISLAWVLLVGINVAIALFWGARSGVLERGESFLLLFLGLALTVLLAGGLWRRLVRAERLADERTAALHESEQQFRRLLEDIPNIAVQGYDQERRVIFWNDASERLYGYHRDEALGQPLEELIIPPPMRPQVIENVGRWIQESWPVPAAELELLRKDGSLVPVYSSHVMMANSQGAREMYCLDIDLSERKRAETALLQRDALLKVAAHAAARLLKEPDPNLAVAVCFADLGQANDVDRVYLFENSVCPRTGALLMNQRHEWCADRATVQIDNPELQNLPYVAGGFERWQGILATNEPLAGLVRDFPASERTILEAQKILSILVVPINAQGGFWGFIGFDDCHRERLWTSAERNILQNIASNIGEALARRRAEAGLQDSEERFRLITDHMRDLVCQIDVRGAILYASPSFHTVLGYEVLAILGNSIFANIHPDDRKRVMAIYRAALERNAVGPVEFRYQRADGAYLWLEAVGNPLRDAAGHIRGAVISSRDITERKANAARIDFLAHHDSLTALPNRLLLHDRLERLLSQSELTQSPVALLVLDLDRFKLVNDSLGHELGDQLLQTVARRLQQKLRETDTLSRQGGDEFLILLPDTGQEGAHRVAGNLLEGLSGQPWRIAEHNLGVTASIGISLYPDTGQDRDTLLRQAGTALTYAKNGGGNTFRLFTAGMNVNTLERLHLETDLREALERDEFLLYYQPQIDLATGRIVGAEALLRWRNPARGLVPPGQFISIAEESGLIVPLGAWVLREACRQARVWQQAGLPRITVAVNLSALQFQRADLLETVEQALADSGLPPECLELELTESILIRDVASALTTVRQLRATGLKLSIDDFGTGYSSLSYLQKLAVQTLKIDQSFVRGLPGGTDSAAIVRAIIQLAHSLKLATVAEGVETDAQLAFLRNHGCDQVQGYYFSRPVPAEDFARLLAPVVLAETDPG
ncbi:MAG: EAL domain-containing protein [Candidatus Competibacteraceae bacterium]|nr:MAG: EAL domain-containing protein [Candidatus Competibacteraceae bacterium]